MEWKYKIELKDQNVFAEIETERGVAIPENIKNLIVEENGATPEKHRFMLGNSEKVFGAVLSFNRNERDTDTVFSALDVVGDKNFFPFAIDPFGNYIGISLDDEKVGFWDHESEGVVSTEKKIGDFLDALY